MSRLMVNVELIHDGGIIEQITTDEPELLGEWLIYTAHKMPERERSLRGNWKVRAWEQDS